jgi:UDP-2,3-diacylglucosamine pyrophosphatase LpxH
MIKLNGFEAFLIREGLEKVANEIKADIRNTEESGHRPLMTVGYIDMVMKELKEKLPSLTLKQK